MTTVLFPRTKAEVDDYVAAIRRAGKKIARTRDSARAFLLKHGYITKSGKLTKRYR